MFGPLSLIALASAAIADPRPASPPLLRREITLGRCRITAFSNGVDRAGAAIPDRSPAMRNTFLLVVDGHHILIGPSASGAELRAALSSLGYRASDVDTVIVTALDDAQGGGMLDGDRPAFPTATVFVDRWAVDHIGDRAATGPTIAKALDAYRARSRLRTPDFDLDVVPGVRMAVTSEGPRTGSVRVRCGATVLVFWNGDLREQDRATGTGPAVVPPDRQRFLEEAVARDHLVATAIGPFPGFGHVYRLADGFHWGAIEARGPRSKPRRRGEIYIEPGNDVPVEREVPVPQK
ncbi:hypothetical protein ASG11_06210 [Sphingomonas sp. Leaf357]|uniref:hypothetical protein n=1 Tax=Sphingomonas sp. Leaf357 TaxID=1736350 RepID=UPI0006F62A76|nr:hypothetical protein [Sphingomonas sp. Leaf357]KQS03887.1 hypothetical protein ASG11_06210 [Sphingomonas sp. Leaf357]